MFRRALGQLRCDPSYPLRPRGAPVRPHSSPAMIPLWALSALLFSLFFSVGPWNKLFKSVAVNPVLLYLLSWNVAWMSALKTFSPSINVAIPMQAKCWIIIIISSLSFFFSLLFSFFLSIHCKMHRIVQLVKVTIGYREPSTDYQCEGENGSFELIQSTYIRV